jgi:hypothetical protein
MSSGFLGKREAGVKLILAAAITIPCSFILASMINSPDAKAACDIAAAEWEVSNANGEANRPSGRAHFAKQYNLYRQACPNGHKFVDESKIADAVKAGYIPAKN